jgi:hypothetical protein
MTFRVCTLIGSLVLLANARAAQTFSDPNWSALGSAMNNYVDALVAAGGDLCAGGYFAAGGAADCIAKWSSKGAKQGCL